MNPLHTTARRLIAATAAAATTLALFSTVAGLADNQRAAPLHHAAADEAAITA